MREQRARKALYVNRREELYTEALLREERAPEKTPKGRARKQQLAPAAKAKLPAGRPGR